jgi:hypothetical protein
VRQTWYRIQRIGKWAWCSDGMVTVLAAQHESFSRSAMVYVGTFSQYVLNVVQ